MAQRRILYLTVLVACGVFYWAYREWLSWFLLMGVVFLPWLSLLLSLPAMLSCRASVQCPTHLDMGQEATVAFCGICALPAPPVGGRLAVHSAFCGEKWLLQQQEKLPAAHCGALRITAERIWVYDYLGLFRMKVRHADPCTVLVRPKTVVQEMLPNMSRYTASAWVPKKGGGFGENHELRLYRPGDNLHQVHWKLTAKTGKLIVRQTMEAVQNQAVLTLVLSGTPQQLDTKLGQLQFMSRYLLQKELPHRICCTTGSGEESFSITCEADILRAIDALLLSVPAQPDAQIPAVRAQWRYHIGGDSHES